MTISASGDHLDPVEPGCWPRECDHHCARVCQQYMCPCDYVEGYTPVPQRQRACCKWEVIAPKLSRFKQATSHPINSGDVMTRYFGVARSVRDCHDPARFTGVNDQPPFLHADLASLDTDYSNLLKEREEMASSRQHFPPGYYQYRSIRPYNKTNEDWYYHHRRPRMPPLQDKKGQREMKVRKTSAVGLSTGHMWYLD